MGVGGVLKGVGKGVFTYFLANGRGEDISPEERHFAALLRHCSPP